MPMPTVNNATSIMNRTILVTAARLDVLRSVEVVDAVDQDSLVEVDAHTGREHWESLVGDVSFILSAMSTMGTGLGSLSCPAHSGRLVRIENILQQLY